MLTFEEFKKKYEIEFEKFSEIEIKSYYMMYLENPFEFHPSMIG